MADPVSLATTISSLVIGSTKIIQLANNIVQKYANTELLMSSIGAESSAVAVALAQLQSVLRVRHPHSLGDEDLLKSVEVVSLACGLTMSLLEKYMKGILESGDVDEEDGRRRVHKEKDKDGEKVPVGLRDKIRVLWNEDEIERLTQQMRGHQSSLILLLNVIECQSDAEIRSLLVDSRAVLGLIMNALGVLDIDAVSLSGITWRIEEALESRSASRLLPLKEEEAQMNRISSSFRITDVEDMGTRKSLETRPETSLVVYGENLDPPSEADSPPRSSKPVGKPKKKRNKSSISVALNFFQNIIVKRKPSLPPIPIKVNQHPRCALVGDWNSNYGTIFKALAAEAPDSWDGLYTTMQEEVIIQTSYNDQLLHFDLCFFTDMEDYSRLHQYWYSNIDLFLFCIVTEYADTVHIIRDKWMPIIEEHRNATAQNMLLCTHAHCGEEASMLNTSPSRYPGKQGSPFRHDEGEELAREMGALKYVVCQGTNNNNDIKEMVYEAVSVYLVSDK